MTVAQLFDTDRFQMVRHGDSRAALTIRAALTLLASLLASAGQMAGLYGAILAVSMPEHRERNIAIAAAGIAAGYSCGLLADALGLKLQEDLAGRMEQRAWQRLLRLPVTFFADRSMRELIGYSGAVGMSRGLLGALGAETALSALTAALGSALLIWLDTDLGLVAVGAAVTLLAAAALLGWRQQRHDLVVMDSVDEAQALLFPALSGIEEITAYGAGPVIQRKWQRVFRTQKDADLRGLRYSDAAESLLRMTQPLLLALLCPLAVMWSGTTYVLGGLVVIVLQLSGSLGRLAGTIPALSSVLLAKRRLDPVTTAAAALPAPGTHRDRLRGAVEVADVHYTFEGASAPILRGIDLVAKPGELVAVVGPSGSGKSTLLRLLLAQLTPTGGTVRIDGVSATDWDEEGLRDQMGYVPQSVSLLRGSVRDQVLGMRSGTDEQIWQALEHAGLGDVVRALPLGLDTPVADGASGFSGGQEQRLLLARALLRRPRILLLDEATSALDERTQDQVAQAVAALAMTRIVVAHRHSTIRDADRIYVIRDGRVAGCGSYAQLMRPGTAFADLVRPTTPDSLLDKEFSS